MTVCDGTTLSGDACNRTAKYPEDNPKYCGYHKQNIETSNKPYGKDTDTRKCSKCKCMRIWKGKNKTCDNCRKKACEYKKSLRKKQNICQMISRRGNPCKNAVEGKHRFCTKRHGKYEEFTDAEISRMKRCSKCGNLELLKNDSKICKTCIIRQQVYRKNKRTKTKE